MSNLIWETVCRRVCMFLEFVSVHAKTKCKNKQKQTEKYQSANQWEMFVFEIMMPRAALLIAPFSCFICIYSFTLKIIREGLATALRLEPLHVFWPLSAWLGPSKQLASLLRHHTTTTTTTVNSVGLSVVCFFLLWPRETRNTAAAAAAAVQGDKRGEWEMEKRIKK